MTGFRSALIAGALVFSLGWPLAGAQAQGGPPATPGQGDGRGSGMMGGAWGSPMMSGPGMMRGGGPGYGPGMMGGRYGGGRSSDPQAIDAFVVRQLAFEKAGLKITAQQMPLWDKFAATVRANAKAMAAQRTILATRDNSHDSLPDRLHIREQLMAVQTESLHKSIADLRPLYDALDANQKALAEDFLAVGMGAGSGMF